MCCWGGVGMSRCFFFCDSNWTVWPRPYHNSAESLQCVPRTPVSTHMSPREYTARLASDVSRTQVRSSPHPISTDLLNVVSHFPAALHHAGSSK